MIEVNWNNIMHYQLFGRVRVELVVFFGGIILSFLLLVIIGLKLDKRMEKEEQNKE
jgi:hypothetical protein